RGMWVLVGYGRFGQAISRVLDQAGIPWKAIDPQVHPENLEDPEHLLGGDNTEVALREAGIAEAEVLVAGTDVDAIKLGATTLARRGNPDIFVVIRQNQSADRVLIEAARARLRFVQSDLMVHECLQILKTPMLGRFVWRVRVEGRDFARQVIERVTDAVGSGAPRAWRFQCDVMQPGMFTAFFQKPGEPLQVRHLLANPVDPSSRLAAVALMCERRQESILLPPDDLPLKPGDQLLFVGREAARLLQQRYLTDPHSVEFALTGAEPPRSWVLRRLAERHRRRVAARAGDACGSAARLHTVTNLSHGQDVPSDTAGGGDYGAGIQACEWRRPMSISRFVTISLVASGLAMAMPAKASDAVVGAVVGAGAGALFGQAFD